MGHHMVDFWINICVCHSLIVEDHPTGGKVYQVGHFVFQLALYTICSVLQLLYMIQNLRKRSKCIIIISERTKQHIKYSKTKRIASSSIVMQLYPVVCKQVLQYCVKNTLVCRMSPGRTIVESFCDKHLTDLLCWLEEWPKKLELVIDTSSPSQAGTWHFQFWKAKIKRLISICRSGTVVVSWKEFLLQQVQ